MMHKLLAALALSGCLAGLSSPAAAQRKYTLHNFEKRQLSKDFFCEGASFGDLNRDGKADVISGPYWYEGPAFDTRHAFYEPKTYDTKRYSENFFVFVHDFDGDGWNDILVIGFPGKDASWYRNPQGVEGHWRRHKVFDVVDNESPTFVDVTGDGKPELVCQTGDRMGFAAPDWTQPDKPWKFHPVSVKGAGGRFTHGLGVGDIDGDGRKDILWRHGWWQQPESLAGDPAWQMHLFNFAGRGGAQMYVYDVDGDGDNDVISSHNAHGYGLFWFEQVLEDGKLTFQRHRIMGERPTHNRYGIVFGNLHALDLVDMDRDGLLDIVTGNRFWAHGGRDKADRGKAPVYWFRLVRTGKGAGAHFVPHVIDAHSGVGTQVVAGDIDGDGYPDVVVGNKMGTFVHIQKARRVTRGRWMKEQREFIKSVAARRQTDAVIDRSKGYLPKGDDGKPLNFDFETGDLRDWETEGRAFTRMPNKGDTVNARRKDFESQHAGEYWVGTFEPRTSDKPRGTLTSVAFTVTDRFASFLIAGGKSRRTRMELVRADNDEILLTASGRNREELRPESVDLKKYVGKKIFIRLIDEASGGWGHINFDDFRLHAKDPWSKGGGKTKNSSTRQIDGFSPQDAAARMSVPDGFKVDVIAGEPDLHQPIAFCIDEKGRLWVAEAHSYPVRKKGDKAKDQILVFEDTNGDGAFDKRTVFVHDLNLVSGLEVGFGGVWVGAAPYLMFIPDRDGDLAPDGKPEILLDGWGYHDTHETLNAFIWGPDGWLYGCHGVFTHSKVGKPGTKAEDRVKLNAGVWRYHPTRHEFEVFAWGASNQWGVDFNDHGQAFITACVIPHLYHVVQGGRYQRQSGKHFNRYVFDDIKTIADHLHYLGAKAHAGNGVSNSVGGGHAHCGGMIYLGGKFPEQYRNVIFMSNIHGNRINTDILRRDGSGFVGSHGADFMLANDKWFRGINFRYGPGGNVFLIDWYDEQACHLRRPEVWDRTNGRLYRISYGDDLGDRVDLSTMSDAELVELQLHQNDWYVRNARRLLQERGGNPKVWRGLLAILHANKDVTRQLRALWALHATGGMTESLALQTLKSGEEYVRAWTVQLVSERRKVGADVAAALVAMAKSDPSPVVRLYLASAMQRLSGDLRWSLAEGLVGHGEDVGDHNLPLLAWYGLEPLVAEDLSRAVALLESCQLPTVERFVYRRLATLAGGGPKLVEAVVGANSEERVGRILREMVIALGKRDRTAMPAGWPAAYRRAYGARRARTREDAQTLAVLFGDDQVLPGIRKVLVDRSAKLSRRRWALDNLLRVKDPNIVRVLQGLLTDRKFANRAIRALARFDDPKTPGLLLARFEGLQQAGRKAVVSTLSSRVPFAKALLNAIVAKRIPKSVLDSATTRRQIRGFEDSEVDALMATAWGRTRPTSKDKQADIQKYKKMLTNDVLAKANLSTGRAVYAKTCMQCHVLFGQGTALGPDITGSNRADLDYVLNNIINPSGEVAKEYMLTSVETKDGAFYAGMIVEDTDTAVTVRSVTGDDQVVLKNEIAADEKGKPRVTTMPISMMPEGQLAALEKDEIRDLIAYLASDEQVPMTATAESLARFFNLNDLSCWDADPKVWSVEDGEIVGHTTAGLAKNNFAMSHLDFGDFRMIVEVKLTGNIGNSGIQFRSARDGAQFMKGYQADMGTGWWGKLYEEHARGKLWDKNSDHHVKNGEWNTYEILAVGHRIRTAINGHLCVDLDDPKGDLRGIIGLQVHSGGPMEVRFRDFRFELDPEFELRTVK